MRPTVIKIKKKKKTFPKIFQVIFGSLFIIIFGTIGIDAADHFGNLSDSIFGRLLFSNNERCPSDMAYVPNDKGGFCVDKYENSPDNNCPIKDMANISQSQTNIDDPGCKSVSVPDVKPWVNISQDQAIRLCAKDGKRLPTNQEWQAAALGTPDNMIAWGADDCHVNNNWQNQPGATGSGKNCASYVGAFDMIGNIWEWVNGSVSDGNFNGRKLPESGYVQSMNASDALPGQTSDVPNDILFKDNFWVKDSGTRGILRGGYWDSKSDAGQYSVYAVEYPQSFGRTIGFRCVK